MGSAENSSAQKTGDRLAAAIIRSATLLLASVIVLTVIAVNGIVDLSNGTVQLKVEASAEELLSKDEEGTGFYTRMRRLFGNDQTILVTVASPTLFSAEVFAVLSDLTTRLEQIEGVAYVQSLANALLVDGTEYGMDVAPIAEKYPHTAEGMKDLEARVLADPVYSRNLVSESGDSTVIVVLLREGLDFDSQQAVSTAVAGLIERYASDLETGITGIPHIDLQTTIILLDDLSTIPLIMTLVIAAVLVFSFRSVRGVVIPLLTVFITVIWTLATIVQLGYMLNVVTVLVPPLLMILSLSYAVHVVSEFDAAFRESSSTGPAHRPLRDLIVPVALTGLTTAVGFLSLLLSPLEAVRQFGLFSVIGVCYATVLSLCFAPALYLQFNRLRPARQLSTESAVERSIDHLIGRIAHFDTRYRTQIYVATVILVIVAVFGMTQIRVSMEHLTNFKADSSVRQDFEAANRQLHGVTPLYVVVEAEYRDAFKQPVNLAALESLQQWLRAQDEVGGVMSIVDYVKILNSAMNNNDPASRVIPESQEFISQLLFLGSSDEMERVIDSRFQVANLVVRAGVVDSDDVLDLVGRINSRLLELPGHLQARVTGYPVLINQAVDRIIRGQAESVFTALIVVYLILVVMFLSFRVGFIALLPNMVPIVMYFGVMGMFGISLNPSTSLIAPMVLGIAIDDTIHYMARFNAFAKRTTDTAKAAEGALRVVGRPVTYTSVGLCLGFLVLTSSELRMQEQVGLMASMALAIAWGSDFFLTPALCSRLKIATLWDVLSIDLGARPQETIPLFRGLSAFQARIFARMVELVPVEAGKRLITKGDIGDAMYVVIDGSLQASIERGGQTVKLDRHARGDLVGEAGLFFAERTANVDVLESGRLLRISKDNLNVLGRRYPRIATKIYRNLNMALATRLVSATERIGQVPAMQANDAGAS